MPSATTVENGTYFPLSRPLFVYVSAKSAEKPEIKEFTDFYLNNVGTLAVQVNYVPLPNKAYALTKDNIKKKKLGTVFGGEPEVGLRIEELLKMEVKQ